ncbi:hypothetical protein E3N88_24593 [Mikania micrantha]|uniref:Uncharacterized protein n=1 Tax=Mikania micrantha TaxID=192012 RepID=A0A5N6N2B0_9ASTR|nr:hypothetical protein E3N88_24593 [Mikania micrantha]
MLILAASIGSWNSDSRSAEVMVVVSSFQRLPLSFQGFKDFNNGFNGFLCDLGGVGDDGRGLGKGCQAYRLTLVGMMCRYARIRYRRGAQIPPARIAYRGHPGSGIPPGLNFKPNKLVLLFWPIPARFSTVKHHSSVVWTLLVN